MWCFRRSGSLAADLNRSGTLQTVQVYIIGFKQCIFYLWLSKNNHTDKVKSYIGTEGNVSQKLRGLQGRKMFLEVKSLLSYSIPCKILMYNVLLRQMFIKTYLQCWGWWGCISQYLACVNYRRLDPPPLLVPDVWPLTRELFCVAWTDLKQMEKTLMNNSTIK